MNTPKKTKKEYKMNMDSPKETRKRREEELKALKGFIANPKETFYKKISEKKEESKALKSFIADTKGTFYKEIGS